MGACVIRALLLEFHFKAPGFFEALTWSLCEWFKALQRWGPLKLSAAKGRRLLHTVRCSKAPCPEAPSIELRLGPSVPWGSKYRNTTYFRADQFPQIAGAFLGALDFRPLRGRRGWLCGTSAAQGCWFVRLTTAQQEGPVRLHLAQTVQTWPLLDESVSEHPAWYRLGEQKPRNPVSLVGAMIPVSWLMQYRRAVLGSGRYANPQSL